MLVLQLEIMKSITEKWGKFRSFSFIWTLVILGLIAGLNLVPINAFAATSSGSIGLEGKISAPPPTSSATITFPTNGSTSTEQSVTVTGVCPKGLLVKIFKNNVFSV
jgi:hypothetical protein